MTIEAAFAPRSADGVRRNIRTGLMLAVFVFGLSPVAASAASGPASPADSTTCGQALPNVQDCLTSVSQGAYRTGDVGPLKNATEALRKKIATDKGPALHYRTYWLAYADYVMAAQLLGLKRAEDVRAATADADALLDKVENKDQETYALQYLILLLRFAVAQPTEVTPLVARTADLKARLTKTDSIRGLYALALADYYTPKQYGGGRVAEGLLRQALATPPEPVSALRPTWGKDQNAALLVQLLKKQGADAEATSLLSNWRQKYPDSVALAMASSAL